MTTTKMKHTAGPWKVVTSWNDYMVEGPNGEEIIWQDGNYDTPTIKLEDARLIASAPELLEACKLALDANFDCNDQWAINLRRKLENAISKAEGSI